MSNIHFQLRVRTTSGLRLIDINSEDIRFPGAQRAENKYLVTLFIYSYLALLADSPISREGRRSFGQYRKFYKLLCADLKGTVLLLNHIAHEFVSRQNHHGVTSSIGDMFVSEKKCPISMELISYQYSVEKDTELCRDPEFTKYIYTFLSFGKKLEFLDESFYDVALRDWLDVEDRLSRLELLDVDVSNLRLIISTLFTSRPQGAAFPKHGPGHVAERGVGVSPIAKHSVLAFDKLIDRFLFHGVLGKDGLGRDDSYSKQVLPDPTSWKEPRAKRPRPPARLLFVPKNLKTARSICEEPATLMFFQQGIMRQMVGAIRSSRLAKFIKLDSQDRNKRLAHLGSCTTLVDTLDLSAASDSVHIDLVKAIFPSSWLIPMLTTRSSTALLPNGTVKVLKKFAPMGSALCFPTQCIIFAAVCVYASALYQLDLQADDPILLTRNQILRAWRLTSSNEVTYHLQKTGRLNPLAIYGDDIVCDNRITDRVKTLLTRLGFSVNENKSFVGSQSFRESCGGFFLAGLDVSPTYFTVSDARRLLTPNHVYSHVSLLNKAYCCGYRNLYRALLRALLDWKVPANFGSFGVPFRFGRFATVRDICDAYHFDGCPGGNWAVHVVGWREGPDGRPEEFQVPFDRKLTPAITFKSWSVRN